MFQEVSSGLYEGVVSTAYECVNDKSKNARKFTKYICENTYPTPVKIAIIDTGFNLEHPACKFVKCRVIHCENVTGEDPDNITDDHGHGTQILSIYNELFKEFTQAVQFVLIKAVGKDSRLTIENFRKAIVRLLQPDMAGVHIVSVSAGFHITPGVNYDLGKKIEELKSRSIIIAAASNGGAWNTDCIAYPAKVTICIGSVDQSGNCSPFTPRGLNLHFLALGSDLPVAANRYKKNDSRTHYTVTSGTSYAVPVVVSFVVHFLIQLPLHLLGKHSVTITLFLIHYEQQ